MIVVFARMCVEHRAISSKRKRDYICFLCFLSQELEIFDFIRNTISILDEITSFNLLRPSFFYWKKHVSPLTDKGEMSGRHWQGERKTWTGILDFLGIGLNNAAFMFFILLGESAMSAEILDGRKLAGMIQNELRTRIFHLQKKHECWDRKSVV